MLKQRRNTRLEKCYGHVNIATAYNFKYLRFRADNNVRFIDVFFFFVTIFCNLGEQLKINTINRCHVIAVNHSNVENLLGTHKYSHEYFFRFCLI